MIGIALFGSGRMGQIHGNNLAKQQGVKFVCVSDPFIEGAQKLADSFNAKATADVDTALNDPAVQAVVIASPTTTHSDLILKAAAAGKHIFCEKPVDLSVDRANNCQEAVQKAGVHCMIGFQRRFDPTFQAARQAIDQGEIGKVEQVIVTSRDPGPPPMDYIKTSGGIFRDMLIHDFDICQWMAGEKDEAEWVFSGGSCLVDKAILDAGDIDTTAVTIKMKSGVLCQINTTRRAAYGYDQRFEVNGSLGLIQAGNHRPVETTLYTQKNVATSVPEHFFIQRYLNAYAKEMEHFAAVLRGEEKCRSDIQNGVRAQKLADAAARSYASGEKVYL